MVSTIKYSTNASSDHHPNQVPGILIIMNPKQPNLPTCSVTSTYLLFHLLSNPSLHLIANTTLGIIMTAIKISPKTLNHSILSTIKIFDFLNSPNLKLSVIKYQQQIPLSNDSPVRVCLYWNCVLLLRSTSKEFSYCDTMLCCTVYTNQRDLVCRTSIMRDT